MGGLTPHRPFRTVSKAFCNRSKWQKQRTSVFDERHLHPRLGNSFVNSPAWFDDVLKGYNEFDEAIETTLQRDLRQWFACLNPCFPVRAIYRDTWTCQKILNGSCAGRHLRSVFHREAYFAQLPASLQAIYPSHTPQSKIVFSEIDQLRQLDIPYFISESMMETFARAAAKAGTFSWKFTEEYYQGL